MIKLQDFARDCGVTDRAIQKHLKNHEKQLEGHFQRRGKNGTWLDQTAQEYIRSLMVQQPIVVGDAGQLQENDDLRNKVTVLQEKLIAAQELLLEANKAIAEGNDARLALAASEAAQAALEASRDEFKAQAEKNAQRASEEAQKAAEAAQREQEALREAQTLREQLEALKGRSWWARLTRKGE